MRGLARDSRCERVPAVAVGMAAIHRRQVGSYWRSGFDVVIGTEICRNEDEGQGVIDDEIIAGTKIHAAHLQAVAAAIVHAGADITPVVRSGEPGLQTGTGSTIRGYVHGNPDSSHR